METIKQEASYFLADVVEVFSRRRTWAWIAGGIVAFAALVAFVYPLLAWLLSVD